MPDFDLTPLIDAAMLWAPKLAGALLILAVGFWVIQRLVKVMRAMMEKANLDPSLVPFLSSIVSVLLKVMVLIAAAGLVGIETTSFVAILGAAGLAIGLALQGSLQNFSSGVMILLFKPYRVGDMVELQGFTGRVREIQVFNTILITLDNRKVVIPNSSATSGPIVNLTSEGKIRVDMVFGIAYGASIELARSVIEKAAAASDKILTDPMPEIFVIEHGASSINLAVRPWCAPDDYWPVYFYMHEALKKAFDEAGIGIPYTTYDVNIITKPS